MNDVSGGVLYVVATPIGCLGDISRRAVEVLGWVDVIAAEDTRHSQRLLSACQITTPLMAVHKFNEMGSVAAIVEKLKAGQSVALISDAGTPLISDPGERLVAGVAEAGFDVVPIPGACAVVAALSVSGLPATPFHFEGFLPAKAKQREDRLRLLVSATETLVFYEAPHRVVATVAAMANVFSNERKACIAREMTKQYEQYYRDALVNCYDALSTGAIPVRGEFVIVVAGAEKTAARTEVLSDEASRVLDILLEECTVKTAASVAAKITGESKKLLYNEALARK